MNDYDVRLQSLGLSLPSPPKPVANYLPVASAGDLLFLSGMLPFAGTALAFSGKVGVAPPDLTIEQGRDAARVALLNALAVIAAECGTLDAVRRVVRMAVHVACGPGFTAHSAVANGASDLLVDIFGTAGRHSRLALGAVSLPLNSPVELELIVQISQKS
jgi:enamine deaminase RidA (YjgF/YER057c/UK114 family)